MKAVVVDLGAGNLFSISCALKKLGLEASISSRSRDLGSASAIILPGVGNFGAAASNLRPLRSQIVEQAKHGTPLLGICLGMQLLFKQSQEGPGTGLDLIQGDVLRLPTHVKIPHMGWNTLLMARHNEILDGIGASDHFYFVHSYYTDVASKNLVVAETDYGVDFPSVLADNNIYGTQFHPEKSGRSGETVLRNFLRVMKK